MRPDSYRQQFCQFFAVFKARSTLISLEQLANALAELGMALDNSTISHWQRGVRVPRDRDTLLRVIKVFFLHQGIRNMAEANQMLAALDQFPLTPKETAYVVSEEVKLPPQEAPPASWPPPPDPDALTSTFHMMLPAKLDRYLEIQAKIKQVSKAMIIRQLIENHMREEGYEK